MLDFGIFIDNRIFFMFFYFCKSYLLNFRNNWTLKNYKSNLKILVRIFLITNDFESNISE